MTLIICEECGKKYSSNAKACPECANPTPKVIKEEIVYKEPEVVKSVKKEKKPLNGILISKIIVSVILALIVFFNTLSDIGALFFNVNILIFGRFSYSLFYSFGGFILHFLLFASAVIAIVSCFFKKSIFPLLASIGLYICSLVSVIGFVSTIKFIFHINIISALLLFFESLTPIVLYVFLGTTLLTTFINQKKEKNLNKINLFAILSIATCGLIVLARIIYIVIGVVAVLIEEFF